MNKIFLFLLIGSSLSAGLFSSCRVQNPTPKPIWVSKPDYSIAGHYVGIGSSNSEDKAQKESEKNALANLVEQIEVTISSSQQHSTTVKNDKLTSQANTSITTNSKEILRDFRIKERWIDPTDCSAYTLVTVSRASVERTKQEKIAQERLMALKSSLLKGTDSSFTASPKLKLEHLQEAKQMLDTINFSITDEPNSKELFAKKITTAIAKTEKEVADISKRTAVFINVKSKTTPAELVQMFYSKLQLENQAVEFSSIECLNLENCLTKAASNNFETFTWIDLSSTVETKPTGVQKGSLQMTQTLFSTTTKLATKPPLTAVGHVIGWDGEALNWEPAVIKVAKGAK